MLWSRLNIYRLKSSSSNKERISTFIRTYWRESRCVIVWLKDTDQERNSNEKMNFPINYLLVLSAFIALCAAIDRRKYTTLDVVFFFKYFHCSLVCILQESLEFWKFNSWSILNWYDILIVCHFRYVRKNMYWQNCTQCVIGQCRGVAVSRYMMTQPMAIFSWRCYIDPSTCTFSGHNQKSFCWCIVAYHVQLHIRMYSFTLKWNRNALVRDSNLNNNPNFTIFLFVDVVL